MSKTNRSPSEGELFKKVLGNEWLRLHPNNQRRFDKNPTPGTPLRYTGIVDELKSSFIGKLLGFMTLPIIKGALIPYDDGDFPVDIEVYCKDGSDAIFKERLYQLNMRKPIKFTSYMRESEQGEVLEYVGLGLAMKLVLSVRDGNLHFRSDGYFWDLFGWRIPIPDLFTPGTADILHVNEGTDRFRIRMEIKHRLFGRTFFQTGKFWEVSGDSALSKEAQAVYA